LSAMMINKQKEAAAAKRKAKKEVKQKEEEVKLAALTAVKLKSEEEAKRIDETKRKREEATQKLEKAKLAAEERKKKNAEETAAAALALTATHKSTSSKSSSTSDSDSGRGILSWLLPLIIVLLLISAVLLYFRGCEGCGNAPIVDPVTVDTIVQDTIPAVPYGKGGEALGFLPGSMEFLMADHLSAFDSEFPRTFNAENIAFSKNRIRLNTKARNQLDNLAVLLKEYANAEIEIYGYVAKGEKTFYKGNKEVSLDDARANEVYIHLKKDGIEEGRMEFYGNGLGDQAGVKVKLISRGG